MNPQNTEPTPVSVPADAVINELAQRVGQLEYEAAVLRVRVAQAEAAAARAAE
jgi:hypothetical protein